MKVANPDDSAFSAMCPEAEEVAEIPGLTKREYFAAIALQGLLARGASNTTTLFDEDTIAIRANLAVIFADALVAALNIPRGGDET